MASHRCFGVSHQRSASIVTALTSGPVFCVAKFIFLNDCYSCCFLLTLYLWFQLLVSATVSSMCSKFRVQSVASQCQVCVSVHASRFTLTVLCPMLVFSFALPLSWYVWLVPAVFPPFRLLSRSLRYLCVMCSSIFFSHVKSCPVTNDQSGVS